MSNKGACRTLVLEEASARESSGDESGGGGAEETEEEREIRELEAEVKEMAERIQHFRRTAPSLLAQALSSQLAAQRPRLPFDLDAGAQDRASQGGAAGSQHEGTSEEPETSIPDGDPEICERLQTFRAKISSNIDAMPNILKRIHGCIARIKRADQNAVVIHPVFKKRRKS